MLTQSELMRYLSEISHLTLSDLFNRGNRLRKNGDIRSGGRGRSAGEIETDEVALIILAAMSGVSADDCPEAAKKLRDLESTERITLGQLLTTILDDPLKADHVKKFTVDHINGYAVLTFETREDGNEVVFGDRDEDKFNSGVKIFLHGRVFRLLATHLENRKISASWSTEALKAHMEYTKQVIKIGSEQGEEAAMKWMKENPFTGENPFKGSE